MVSTQPRRIAASTGPRPARVPVVEHLVAAVSEAQDSSPIDDGGAGGPPPSDRDPAEPGPPAYEDTEVDRVILAREFAALLQEDAPDDEEQA